jgi:hypothetical protein
MIDDFRLRLMGVQRLKRGAGNYEQRQWVTSFQSVTASSTAH